eukprot:3501518-Rhodomonas_salina.1
MPPTCSTSSTTSNKPNFFSANTIVPGGKLSALGRVCTARVGPTRVAKDTPLNCLRKNTYPGTAPVRRVSPGTLRIVKAPQQRSAPRHLPTVFAVLP